MSMAADRAYLAAPCLTTMPQQDEHKIASAAGKPQNRVLAAMRKVTIAAMITILFAGAAIGRAEAIQAHSQTCAVAQSASLNSARRASDDICQCSAFGSSAMSCLWPAVLTWTRTAATAS
jgi:hypothetical protein